MKKRQVVITGAGACGLMAAIMAARNGALFWNRTRNPERKSVLQETADVIFLILQDRMMHTEANIRNLSKMHSESFLSRIPLSFSKK